MRWLCALLVVLAVGCARPPAEEYVTLRVSAIPEKDVNSYRRDADGKDVPCWPDVPLELTWKKVGDRFVSPDGGELAPTGIEALRSGLAAIPEGDDDLLDSLGVTRERVEKFALGVRERTGPLPAELEPALGWEAVSERALARVLQPETKVNDHPNLVFTLEIGGPNPFRLFSTGPTRYGSLPWIVDEGGRRRALSSMRVPRDLSTLLEHTLLGVPPGTTLLGAEHLWEKVFWESAVFTPEQWARLNELYIATLPGRPDGYALAVTAWREAKADITITPPQGPIARLYDLVGLEKGWAEFDWDFSLETYQAALEELEQQPWITDWIVLGTDRSLTLELETFTESTNDLYSHSRGPVHRLILVEGNEPRGVVELYAGGARCVVVEAGRIENGVTNPPGPPTSPHWFDRLYVSQRGTKDHKHTCAEIDGGYPTVREVKAK